MHKQNFLQRMLFVISILFSVDCYAEEVPPVFVDTVKVTQQILFDQAHAQGEIIADKSVIIQSDISGKVVGLDVHEGQPVEADHIIIQLDDQAYQALLKKANAEYEQSQVHYKRLKSLFDKGTGSSSDVEVALTALQLNEANLDIARINLSKTKIKTPFAGILGVIDIDVGDYINPGQPLVDLVDISQLLVDFYLPEKYLLNLKEGLQVDLTADAIAHKHFEGKVFAISPVIDPTIRAIRAKAIFQNENNLLKPGLFSRLNIIFKKIDNALVLPDEALVYRDNKVYVFRIEEDTAHLIEVTTGLQEDGHIQITNGLNKNDEIVLAGQIKLYEGAKIIRFEQNQAQQQNKS